jgi:hypothetical protein
VVPSKVETQSRARNITKQNLKEPSGMTIALGCTSVVIFVVVVIVLRIYCMKEHDVEKAKYRRPENDDHGKKAEVGVCAGQ